MFKSLWFFLTGRWRVVRTGWPYPGGYGTYNERRHVLLDSGLSLDEARAACAELNRPRR